MKKLITEKRKAKNVEREILTHRPSPITFHVSRFTFHVSPSSLLALPLFLFLFLFLFLSLPTSAQDSPTPAEPPDAAAGLLIFNERCANCHGPQALGDGELAANLPNPPAALASPEYLRAAIPANMFDVITNGRVERGMPPFGPTSTNPLPEADRWNAIAAIYSLGTPLERVNEGQALYETNCLACHGQSGAGDGPEAAASTATTPDLTDLTYWSQTSNQAVFDRLHDDTLEGHDFELDDDSLWAAVDYLRTFSYAHTDALAAFRPLESATISGQVINGSTGEETLAEATTAELRAFNQNIEMTLSLTTTVTTDGRYQFNLSDVSPEWLYRVSITYKGLDFGSEIAQLSQAAPEAQLPVTVYEQTSDPSAITVDQMHLIVEVADNTVLVNEVYVFTNNGTAVFIGESGDPADGTVQIALPPAAENPTFERGFGSFDSFFPAQELIPTESGWVDTFPVRPGQSSLILLANYTLPYDNGMTIAHPVFYEVGGANLVLSEVGVEMTEGDGWTSMGLQTIEGGAFISYARPGLSAGESFTFQLSGRPRTTTTTGTVGLVRDDNLEFMIGGVALFAAAVAAVFVVRSWQQEEPPPDRLELLQAIANLDDAYEQGQIEPAAYQQERQALKEELTAVWATDEE
jgi:mono/diheme cytochrome c family protein